MKGKDKLSRDSVRKMILDAIPYDGWVLASDIAEKLGLRSSVVSRVISVDLLHVYVERKKMEKDNRGNLYSYRRLNRVGYKVNMRIV